MKHLIMSTKFITEEGIYEVKGEEGILLRPHYSGNVITVDCIVYKSEKRIKEEYQKKIAKDFLLNSPIQWGEIKYYACEFGPFFTENMELVSNPPILKIL